MKPNKNKEMFSLEISKELREKIRKYAFDNDLTLSKAVRDILEKYFEVNNNDSN